MTPEETDRALVTVLAELRHKLRILAAAEVACNEAQAWMVRTGRWADPGDAALLKRALERWEQSKARRDS